jgi:hypothetical protein
MPLPRHWFHSRLGWCHIIIHSRLGLFLIFGKSGKTLLRLALLARSLLSQNSLGLLVSTTTNNGGDTIVVSQSEHAAWVGEIDFLPTGS